MSRLKNPGPYAPFRRSSFSTVYGVKPDGFWRLTRNRAVRVGTERRTERVLLTEAPAADPDLAAGRWVNLVVRSAGAETEVSANGRTLLTVREPEEAEPQLPPALGAVAFNTRPGSAGPKPDARFEIDYVAAWRPGGPPKLTAEEQAKIAPGSWPVRQDVAPPAGFRPIFDYTVANDFRAFVTDEARLQELRRRYQEYVGPVRGEPVI